MRYAVFSLTLTALFLMACADPDNPVVYTAPAGKVVDDEDEVKQPPGPNSGSEVVIPPPPVDPPVVDIPPPPVDPPVVDVPPPPVDPPAVDIPPPPADPPVAEDPPPPVDPPGSYEIPPPTVVEIPPPPVDPPETAAHTKADDPETPDVDESIHTQSEVDDHTTDSPPLGDNACTYVRVDISGNPILDEHGNQITRTGPCPYQKAWDTGSETLRSSIRNQYREGQLRDDGVLPTVSVSGCGIDTNEDGFNDRARFTFSRNGPTTEGLSIEFRATSITGNRIWRYEKWNSEQFQERRISGFRAGNATFTSEQAIGNGTHYTPKVVVKIVASWQSSMSGDYNVGASSATVTRTSGACN